MRPESRHLFSSPSWAPYCAQETPRNAWIEAEVGIGGPLLGTLGAMACEMIYFMTGNPMFRALAYAAVFS